MQKIFRIRFLPILVGMLCLLLAGVALAQGGFVAYGQSVAGEITDQSPLVLYTFQGNAGDVMTAQVSATAPGLDPTLTLLSPSGVPLANNDNDPFGFNGSDARLNYTLADSGVYSLLVGSANNTRGSFILRLTQRSSSAGAAPLNGAAQVDLTTGTQTLVVPGNPAAVTPITIQSNPPGAPFSVEVRDPGGQTIAVFAGLPSVTLALPAASGDFVIVVTPTTPNAQGSVVVNQGDAPAPPDTNTPPPAPVATEEVAPDGPLPGVCSVTAAGNVTNVRSGPGTDYGVVAQLSNGQYFEVVGINGVWYAVSLPGGGQGWVRSDVVGASGPCDNLPQMGAPTVPNEPVTTEEAGSTLATPTYTATFVPGVPTATTLPPQQPTATTPPQPQQPTATFTPSYTPPAPPTATFTPSYTPTTPPAPQEAPADPRFNNPLDIALDTTGSVTDFVSYPGGDTEDRVRYSVTGMNPNSSLSGGRARLILAVSCFGNNTDQVQFFTNGQTYTCGQTIVDKEVTFDSNTGSVVITAVGGNGTYVQWVLTGTATRVN
ncbi:MAG: SH3 domain-containing protein [Anaerolineaceae bacterium]|nr:SH3 domain-containing protein [Anaerolineaceae bacterium]